MTIRLIRVIRVLLRNSNKVKLHDEALNTLFTFIYLQMQQENKTSFILHSAIQSLIYNYNHMPYVKIQVTREGVTKEQKQALIKGVTQLLQDVLQKDPQRTVVVIEEIDTDNWGSGGEQITEIRKRAKK